MDYNDYSEEIKDKLLRDVHTAFENFKNNELSGSELEGFINETLQEFEVLRDFDKEINDQFRLEKFGRREIPADEWDIIKKEWTYFLMANGYDEQDVGFEENDQALEFGNCYIHPAKYLDTRDSILDESPIQEIDGFAIYGSSVSNNYPSEPDDVDVYIIDFTENHLQAAKIAVLDEARQKADNVIDIISHTQIYDNDDETPRL